MKLAEALLIRSDMQKNLAQLKGCIHNNAKVQEGDTPSEDPNELIVNASQIISGLTDLIERIHRNKCELLVRVVHDETKQRYGC